MLVTLYDVFNFVCFNLKIILLLLSLFRTNQVLANVFLIVYLLLVRGEIFISPAPALPVAQGIWSYEILNSLALQPVMAQWIALGLIFFQAVGINLIASRFRISEEITLLAGLFYILLTNMIVETNQLSPALLATTFLILVLFILFETYRNSVSASSIFNLGLWIGVGSLFQFVFGIYIFLAIIGLGILRSYALKEMLMLLIGLFTVYFLVGFSYFYFDAFDIFWNQQFKANIAYFHIISPNTWVTYIERILFGALIVSGVLSQGFFASKRSIQVQKYQTILYYSLVIAGISIFFQANIGMEQLLYVLPALSFFTTYWFLRMSRTNAEAFHLLWLFLAIAIQFHEKLGF
jgi:hypothetical protein